MRSCKAIATSGNLIRLSEAIILEICYNNGEIKFLTDADTDLFPIMILVSKEQWTAGAEPVSVAFAQIISDMIHRLVVPAVSTVVHANNYLFSRPTLNQIHPATQFGTLDAGS
jgi:hypothetical protein